MQTYIIFVTYGNKFIVKIWCFWRLKVPYLWWRKSVYTGSEWTAIGCIESYKDVVDNNYLMGYTYMCYYFFSEHLSKSCHHTYFAVSATFARPCMGFLGKSTSFIGYNLYWVRIVLDTSCLSKSYSGWLSWYELSLAWVFLVTSCPRHKLSWVRVVLDNCLWYELSRSRWCYQYI